jgi:hypothetical protein
MSMILDAMRRSKEGETKGSDRPNRGYRAFHAGA